DALMMGPFDLSMSLGLRGRTGHPEVVRSLDRILAAGAKAGVDVGCCLFTTDPAELQAQARAWKAKGVRIFTNPSEGILLYAAYRSFRQGVAGE
ncbi:MAG: aldolase/citrate lyase family protein, partial [Thermodesulfobacteriota bacterium]